jgi:hypothetical protein
MKALLRLYKGSIKAHCIHPLEQVFAGALLEEVCFLKLFFPLKKQPNRCDTAGSMDIHSRVV